RAIFRSRRKFQTDYGSDMATARDNGRAEGLAEGRKEGRQEGRQEGKLEIARMMLSAGEPMEKIMSYTGLTRQEITQI
ncbi:MAG: transposase, partial [Oscillospiraceae bacterium]|nr:transposase [Oscillospiraceae bacterium]